MTITIDPADNSHYMAEMRLDSEVIVSNEFNVDLGEDGGDPKTVTNSMDPVRYGSSKNTVNWGASDVDPEYYKMLIEYKLKKKLFPVDVFDFGPDGDYTHTGTLKHAKITEVNKTFGDDGLSIEISGVALGFDMPK